MSDPFLDMTDTGFRRGTFAEDGTFLGITVTGVGLTYGEHFGEIRPLSGDVSRIVLTRIDYTGELRTYTLSEMPVTDVAELYALYSYWDEDIGFFGVVLNLDGEKVTYDDVGESGLVLNSLAGYSPDNWVDLRGGDDFVQSKEGDDRVNGGNGNDTLIGGDGNDDLRGQNGNDVLRGDDGNDMLRGGSGMDTLLGGLGDDTLNGGSGDDVLSGEDGNDKLNGGSGNDEMSGDAGNDRLNGGNGDDIMIGGLGNDRMNGGNGNDVMLGDDGDDRMSGGTGTDFLIAAGGADRMTGGADADTFAFVDAGVTGSADVFDFNTAEDFLAVQYQEDTTAAEQFALFLANAQQVGSHVIWSNSTADYEAKIRNLDLDDLTMANFIDVDGTLVSTF